MELDDKDLLRPLLNPADVPPPRCGELDSVTTTIVLRLFFVLFIGALSVWASHEASKGFAVTVINESGDSIAGKRFDVFYVSNDAAIRAIVGATKLVEDFLYSDRNREVKKVRAVIVKLANRTLTQNVVVEKGTGTDTDHEFFVITLSPSIMEGAKFDQALFSAVLRGVTRVLLWDGQGHAPRSLIDGIVEHIAVALGGGDGTDGEEPPPSLANSSWRSDDPRHVAEFLGLSERRRPGFIGRLNAAMKDGWDDSSICVAAETERINVQLLPRGVQWA